jgi:hypothetical protein
MREIIKKPWNYTFFEDDGKYYLSVSCGTVAVFDINVQLTPEEINLYNEVGENFIDKLVGEIQYAPKEYSNRHLSKFPSQ